MDKEKKKKLDMPSSNGTDRVTLDAQKIGNVYPLQVFKKVLRDSLDAKSRSRHWIQEVGEDQPHRGVDR